MVKSLPQFDVGQHFLQVLLRNQRPDVRVWVQRIADAELLGALHEARHELVHDAAVHEDTCRVRAHLSAAVPVCQHGGGHGVLEVRIVHDDEGGLSPELHGDALHRRRGRLVDLLSGRHAAGERHFFHVRMRRKKCAGAPISQKNIETPRWQPSVRICLSACQGGKGSILGGFEDHRIPRRERRSALPGGPLDWVVPRTDSDADPQRLATRVGKAGGFQPEGTCRSREVR